MQASIVNWKKTYGLDPYGIPFAGSIPATSMPAWSNGYDFIVLTYKVWVQIPSLAL